jgi:hypothetical protein
MEDRMVKYTVTGLKDFSVSADGKEASFVMTTKYAGDMAFTMPASCLDALKGKPAKVAATNGDKPAEKVTKTQGVLHKPKKWILGAETTKHKIVALIFDPQSDRETGFALSPKSAKDLAEGLVKSADTVVNYTPPVKN